MRSIVFYKPPPKALKGSGPASWSPNPYPLGLLLALKRCEFEPLKKEAFLKIPKAGTNVTSLKNRLKTSLAQQAFAFNFVA